MQRLSYSSTCQLKFYCKVSTHVNHGENGSEAALSLSAQMSLLSLDWLVDYWSTFEMRKSAPAVWQCWHPELMLVWVLATPLLMWVSANVPGNAVEDGPSTWGLAPMWETGWNSRILPSAWPTPSCCSYLRNDPADRRCFLSLSLSLSFSLSLYLSNKTNKSSIK